MDKNKLILKSLGFILGMFLYACQGEGYSSNEQLIIRPKEKSVLTDAQIKTLKKSENIINKMLSFENGIFTFNAKSGAEVGLDEYLFNYCLKQVEARNQLITNLMKEGYIAVEIKRNCVALTKSKNKIQPMRSIIINKEYSAEVPSGGKDGICLTDLYTTDVYLSESTMKEIINLVKEGYSDPVPSWIPSSIASDLRVKLDLAKNGSGIIAWLNGYFPCMHIREKHMHCTYESQSVGATIWLTYET